ncbi:unnamed protein product [Chironomus riparius]|uniref:Uncharacterized protein n=1 Tax=Chironomus riparius TaxID=315576 RepID=A0A9N9RXF3_9DIPT|nr:unnamed protein product [Chironomus riparius]
MENSTSKVSEVDFGYNHVNDGTRVVYPGVEDSTSTKYTNGDFINHRSTVTLVVKGSGSNNNTLFLCWILILVLLFSIIVSIVIILCVCVKAKSTRRKQESRIATHINGFASPVHYPNHSRHSIEMLPKYVPSPAQSYSTQKLYQWCQQRELQQQYKSLWTVNPQNDTEQIHTVEPSENPNAYKTRSLPSKNKQRPVSSIEDLDELYSKVNFSKKLRNRMTNNEAKIIAFCRSRSQNLSQYSGSNGGVAKEEAFVVYDERTAL